MGSTLTVTSHQSVFNAADYLVDRHIREGRGDRTAVVTSTRTLTYRDLAAAVHRVAGGLRRLGVRPEERVMLCMADDVELFTGILGAMYIGAVAVPVSTMLTGRELGTLLTDSRAKILCASTEFAAAATVAAADAAEVDHVVFDEMPAFEVAVGASVHHWDALSTAEPVSVAYDTWADSPALWLYTSGTTGTPKAAMHRHDSIRAVAENYGVGVLGIGPQDRCLSVAKLFFAYGIGNSCFFPMSVGATTVLERARPTPSAIGERVRATQPTLFFAVPTFYATLVASDLAADTFSAARHAISAGEPLPGPLLEHVRHRFGVEVLDGIGSTEALHIFLSNRPGQVRSDSSGTPVPGYEVELRTEDGAVIDKPGHPGTLFLRGPSIAAGYWCKEDTTRQVFQGDWLRTGDAYVLNDDGTYSCMGRSGDMLKAGGIWVSPSEIEQRLLEHPDVEAAAVVAAPDEAGLDKPVACVVLREGSMVESDKLIAWCREELAAFKRPRAVVMMNELPKTSTGKLRRDVLREQVADVLVTRR